MSKGHRNNKSAACETCGTVFFFYACPSAARRNCGRFCSTACCQNRTLTSFLDRFFNKIGRKTGTGCIPWTGTITRGYGVIGRGRSGEGMVRATHVAYELAYGPVPANLCVLHACDNPQCVNPGHLFIGTQADNMKDMYVKNRHALGADTGLAKVTPEIVIAIRRDVARGIPQQEIAKRLGITQSNVSCIALRKTWKHV